MPEFLSSAVCKEISKNISGLINYEPVKAFAQDIISGEKFKGLKKHVTVTIKK